MLGYFQKRKGAASPPIRFQIKHWVRRDFRSAVVSVRRKTEGTCRKFRSNREVGATFETIRRRADHGRARSDQKFKFLLRSAMWSPTMSRQFLSQRF